MTPQPYVEPRGLRSWTLISWAGSRSFISIEKYRLAGPPPTHTILNAAPRLVVDQQQRVAMGTLQVREDEPGRRMRRGRSRCLIQTSWDCRQEEQRSRWMGRFRRRASMLVPVVRGPVPGFCQ
ncbi:hypothetical protein GCM10009560_25720 [Nonomuraea longicatena]|uniref:Uncharacterized protein n=1 Tax=Nonomuraea longicatena TaxID=83682 RepID=A0ABN1P8X5_9ACTN